MFLTSAAIFAASDLMPKVWQPEEMRDLATSLLLESDARSALESAAKTIEYLRGENRKLVALAYPPDPPTEREKQGKALAAAFRKLP